MNDVMLEEVLKGAKVAMETALEAMPFEEIRPPMHQGANGNGAPSLIKSVGSKTTTQKLFEAAGHDEAGFRASLLEAAYEDVRAKITQVFEEGGLEAVKAAVPCHDAQRNLTTWAKLELAGCHGALKAMGLEAEAPREKITMKAPVAQAAEGWAGSIARKFGFGRGA